MSQQMTRASEPERVARALREVPLFATVPEPYFGEIAARIRLRHYCGRRGDLPPARRRRGPVPGGAGRGPDLPPLRGRPGADDRAVRARRVLRRASGHRRGAALGNRRRRRGDRFAGAPPIGLPLLPAGAPGSGRLLPAHPRAAPAPGRRPAWRCDVPDAARHAWRRRWSTWAGPTAQVSAGRLGAGHLAADADASSPRWSAARARPSISCSSASVDSAGSTSRGGPWCCCRRIACAASRTDRHVCHPLVRS